MEWRNVAISMVIIGYFTGKIFGTDSDVCSALISPHYTDPEFTCCGGKGFPPPLKNKLIDKCVVDRKKGLVDSSWNSYKCVIENALGGNTLSLETFADIMTKTFTGEIQNKIKNALQKHPRKTDYKDLKFPEYKEIMDIRSTYYRIEKQVCTEIATQQPAPMEDPPKRCWNWKERYHGSGDCCADAPIPYQLAPDPYYSTWTLTNYTATQLMPIAGRYTWKNWTYSNNLVQVGKAMAFTFTNECFRTAKLLLSDAIQLKNFTAEKIKNLTIADYMEMSEILIPKFIPQTIRDEMISRMMKNITLDNTLMQVAESPVEQFFSPYEFRSYKPEKIRFLYWRCEAHKALSFEMKDFNITQVCYSSPDSR